MSNMDGTSTGETQPGWYPDPSSGGRMRYWDGQQWGAFQEPGPGGMPQPVQQPIPAAGVGGSDPRSTAALAHYLGILGFIGPLIIMMTNNSNDPFVKDQATEALNFHLTVLIAWFVFFLVTCVTFGLGFVLFPVIIIGEIIFSVMGGQAASKGQWYRYPFNIRMVKSGV